MKPHGLWKNKQIDFDKTSDFEIKDLFFLVNLEFSEIVCIIEGRIS